MSSPFEFINKNGYHHHFCACLFAPLWCLLTVFFPCITVGRTRAIMDRKEFDVTSCLCFHIALFNNRRMVQELHKDELKEDVNSSICGTALFGCCAIIQDAHEVSYRKKHGTLNYTRAPQPIEPPSTEQRSKDSSV